MVREPRFTPGGLAYHAMNRTRGSIKLFEDAGGYELFERILTVALTERVTTMKGTR